MNTDEFLNILHQHGNYAYFWVARGKKSFWFSCSNAQERAFALEQAVQYGHNINIYTPVNPCRIVPTTTKLGQERPSSLLRGRIEHVMLANVFFAEIDAKDFAEDIYQGKVLATKHIKALPLFPTMVVDSGGGYHCYWQLSEPYMSTEKHRELQRRWVDMVGGDKQAKDITRVLRVPGTENRKYGDVRTVEVRVYDPDKTYTIQQLEECLPAERNLMQSTLPAMHASGDLPTYVDAAMRNILFNVATAAPGTRNDALNKAAVTVGNLVAAPWTNLSLDWAKSELVQAAIACGLDQDPGCGMTGIHGTIESGVKAGMRYPRRQPDGYKSTERDYLLSIMKARS